MNSDVVTLRVPPIHRGVWCYMRQCVVARGAADRGGACEVTGGTDNRKIVYFGYVTIKVLKWTASRKSDYASVIILSRYFRNVSLKLQVPSVLWRCWLGGRKGIRPVKKLEWWGTGVDICLERGADLHMAKLMPLYRSLSLASVKSVLVLPFWYRLTRVVSDTGPLNGCVCIFKSMLQTLRNTRFTMPPPRL